MNFNKLILSSYLTHEPAPRYVGATLPLWTFTVDIVAPGGLAMAQPRSCACCRQEEQPDAPLYWLCGSDRFVHVCDRCISALAVGARDHTLDSVLAAWEAMADALLMDLR
jgi:hypothetical protein